MYDTQRAKQDVRAAQSGDVPESMATIAGSLRHMLYYFERTEMSHVRNCADIAEKAAGNVTLTTGEWIRLRNDGVRLLKKWTYPKDAEFLEGWLQKTDREGESLGS